MPNKSKLHYLALDTGGSTRLFDSRTKESRVVKFEGARSFLQDYINKKGLDVISINESQLPDRTQLLCWYYYPHRDALASDPRKPFTEHNPQPFHRHAK